MGISLSKGQTISLSKAGGGSLNKVAVGCGWAQRTVKSSGFFGFGAGEKQVSVDLDLSCLLFDSSKELVDAVFFGKLRSSDGSILHTGDDLTGGGSQNDPNEVINVDLQSVPNGVTSIVFVVNSYSGETFDGVPSAFCNVQDRDKGSEIARYSLTTDGGNQKGFVIAKVCRDGNEWSFAAIGESCSGRQRTVQDIRPQAQRFA